MAKIRNLDLLKRFIDYFKLKSNDSIGSEAGNMLVPVVSIPVPPKILQVIDDALNANDKLLTVPAGKQWKILSGFLAFTTSATAGNRQIRIALQDDADNVFWQFNALNVQIASTTERYNFIAGAETSQEATAAIHSIPLPLGIILTENQDIRILDAGNIDAADDMNIRFIVEETDITGE